jgi:hypothetical protein
MIVRERRRIAALARTASSLDERVQESVRSAEASEAALRSYMDEQRHQLATMTQTQQEQILSLMDMVKQDSDTSFTFDCSEGMSDPKLIVLANERIKVLESQLGALQSEADAAASYRTRIEELAENLKNSVHENEDLKEELSSLRAALKEIKESMTKCSDDSEEESERLSHVLDVVKSALKSPQRTANDMRSSPHASGGRETLYSSPRLKNIQLFSASDSADELDDEIIDWADDIMADLALIAEGKIPPSLVSSPSYNESQSHMEKNVFERLTDPENFTGIQKQALIKRRGKGRRGKRSKSPSSRGQQERRALSKEISDQLDRIVIPGDEDATESASSTPRYSNESEAMTATTSASTSATVGPVVSTDERESRSVFDRLMSPSQYTGTQKDRYHQKAKEKRTASVVQDNEDRLLDDLLQSDSDAIDRSDRGSSSSKNARANSNADSYDFHRTQSTSSTMNNPRGNDTLFPDHYDSRINFRSELMPPDDQDEDEREIMSVPTASRFRETPLERNYNAEYTSLNVFERLTRTTTEAYANKTNRWKRDN